MSTFFIILALVVALLLVGWGVRSRSGRGRDASSADQLDTLAAWPPTATRVLTTAERQAYDILRSALPAHMILAQVPLQRFIKVPTRNSYAEWLRRVGHLSVDLLVCDRHAQVVAVVELKEPNEAESERARRRRLRVIKVLKASQIKVHIWPADALPSIDAAREAILPTPPAPAPTMQAPAPAPVVPAAAIRSLPGRMPAVNPFTEEARDSTADEVIEMREPPPSTWFDDLDTQPAPLKPEPPKDNKDPKNRAAR